MARPRPAARRTAPPKTDIRAEITQGIIDAMLEGNVVPWRMPWTTSARGGLPRNAVTQKVYRGANILQLWLTALTRGYADAEWLTYKQAEALGAGVKAGEKGTRIVFWKFLERANSTDPSKADRIPVARYYTVFHRDQVEGLPLPPTDTASTNPNHQPIAKAERVIASMKNAPLIDIRLSDRAFYSPSADKVVLPLLNQHHTPEEFYSTAFHELAHSTGHESRLNRKSVTDLTPHGSHEYTKEELIAEISAAFLCAATGILPATIENSTAYILNWVKRIKDDPNIIIEAAGAAQRAADFILGTTFDEDVSDDATDSEDHAAEKNAPSNSQEPDCSLENVALMRCLQSGPKPYGDALVREAQDLLGSGSAIVTTGALDALIYSGAIRLIPEGERIARALGTGAKQLCEDVR